MLTALEGRMADVGLCLHPDKTRIVYCKDSNRRGSHESTSFSAEVPSWRLHRWTSSDGREIAKLINPKIRGWMVEAQHLEEGHQEAGRRGSSQAAVLRTLGLGETGRQMTRTARAV